MSSDQLKIKKSNLPKSRIALELNVPATQCLAAYDETLSRLSRSVKLPGFRKGKVPKAVVVQQLGAEQIKASALEKLIDQAWKDAIQKESIKPLCDPDIQGGIEKLFQNFNPSQGINLILETDIEPTPKLKQTKGLEIKMEEVKYDSKKVDELIDQSRKQLATLIPVDNRTATIGDVAVISFKGNYVDNGNEIEGGNTDSMDIDLEKGKMIPGFIEGIIGMALNEEKEINCIFPEDYPQEESKGREAIFTVKLKDLKARELPDLNDDFAKQSSDKSTIKELREDLEQKVKEETVQNNTNKKHEALLNTLVDQLEIDLPKTLIDQEIRNLIEQTARRFAEQGMDVKKLFTQELVQSLMESSKDEAESNLKRIFALRELAKIENIVVSETEIEAKMKEFAKEIPKDQKVNLKKLKEMVTEDILQSQLLEWLEENNTIVKTNTKIAKDKTKPKKTKKSTSKE